MIRIVHPLSNLNLILFKVKVINMHKELRFKIISEGLKNGVSATCEKYNISRTIFYRWLKRYKSLGMEGLDNVKKDFIPANKTKIEIENIILKLIKTYPRYGPKYIKYLLDELGYNISESAVFNVMKRNNLTNKEKRILFAQKKSSSITPTIPPLTELNSGECWVFWITDYGYFENIGYIYEYTLYDLKSSIACTRFYNEVSFNYFEELLTAVAIPVAKNLKFKVNYFCFFNNSKILKRAKNVFKSKLNKIIMDYGLDVKIHILTSNEDLDKIKTLKKRYTEGCLSFLIPLTQEDIAFTELKIRFQEYLRNYNISHKIQFGKELYSPIEYHNKLTNTNRILPIWAYIDRPY